MHAVKEKGAGCANAAWYAGKHADDKAHPFAGRAKRYDADAAIRPQALAA